MSVVHFSFTPIHHDPKPGGFPCILIIDSPETLELLPDGKLGLVSYVHIIALKKRSWVRSPFLPEARMKRPE